MCEHSWQQVEKGGFAVQQLMALWAMFDTRRRVIIGGAAVAMFAVVLGLARLAAQPGMALLYAGLENAAAGEVIQALDARGIQYEVRGDAIYVPQPLRDETRLLLASAGLPTNSHAGYELLDQLSGFGTTSQMFDAAYWRAKEGELARTIVASPHVRAARVHLAPGVTTGFRRDVAPSASVTVTPSAGAFSAVQARAIRYLVASAVAGLQPDAVSVIDGAGGLVYGPDSDPALGAAPTDRAQDLRRRVERLLDAHVGHGNAVVEVSVETITEREVIRERRLDPEQRVMLRTETEENTRASTGAAGAGVTVASNLPDGAAGGGGGTTESRESQTRQRNDFDVSEQSREVERLPGAIRRLSVAVLIDGTRSQDASGAMVWTPRAQDELDALRELVASAVGFDEARGDTITLRSLPFEPVSALGSEARAGFLAAADLDLMTLLQWVFLLFALVFVSLFVLRPILQAGKTLPTQSETRALPGASGTLPALMRDPSVPAGFEGNSLAYHSAQAVQPSDEANDPVMRLRQLIAERQTDSVQVLRHWMDQPRDPVERG
jgi:flagellar M-ring protein FliF